MQQKNIWLFFFSLLTVNTIEAQIPKRELRSVWISTHLSLDWPRSTNASLQQSDFETRLDHVKNSRMNAVYVQVRNECDALYAGSSEPWSAVLTGTQGNPPNPFYDPLQFMLQAARNRGLEFHAWFNPFRAITNINNINNYASTHIARTRPEWLLAQENLRILNPGIPAVRDYVIGIIMDVVRRYDIDGVHIDDYFYPYPPSNLANRFNDDVTYQADPRGFPNTTAGRNDWRRDNINLFIQRLYDSIRTVKPWVKFGVSPFGIWRNQSSDPSGSATNGLQSYSDVFADSRHWMQQGWVDYLTPQIYWSIGFSVANYGVLTPWWNNNANGRHIYIGHAAYKIANNSDLNWNNPSQINNQVRLNRTFPNIFGSTYFRLQNLIDNPLQFRDSLLQYVYQTPHALLPRMPWRNNIVPQPPANLSASINTNQVVLNWTKPGNAVQETEKIRHFVVYRSTVLPIDTGNAANIIFQSNTYDTNTFTDIPPNPANTVYYYAVTALNRFHNESALSNTAVADFTVTAVTTGNRELTELRIAPNPAKESARLSFELKSASVISISILDISGKEYRIVSNTRLLAGKQQLQIEIAHLPAGIYVLRLQTDQSIRTQRLIINR